MVSVQPVPEGVSLVSFRPGPAGVSLVHSFIGWLHFYLNFKEEAAELFHFDLVLKEFHWAVVSLLGLPGGNCSSVSIRLVPDGVIDSFIGFVVPLPELQGVSTTFFCGNLGIPSISSTAL